MKNLFNVIVFTCLCALSSNVFAQTTTIEIESLEIIYGDDDFKLDILIVDGIVSENYSLGVFVSKDTLLDYSDRMVLNNHFFYFKPTEIGTYLRFENSKIDSVSNYIIAVITPNVLLDKEAYFTDSTGIVESMFIDFAFSPSVVLSHNEPLTVDVIYGDTITEEMAIAGIRVPLFEESEFDNLGNLLEANGGWFYVLDLKKNFKIENPTVQPLEDLVFEWYISSDTILDAFDELLMEEVLTIPAQCAYIKKAYAFLNLVSTDKEELVEELSDVMVWDNEDPIYGDSLKTITLIKLKYVLGDSTEVEKVFPFDRLGLIGYEEIGVGLEDELKDFQVLPYDGNNVFIKSETELNITLINMSGQILDNRTVNQKELIYNLNSYTKGMYVLKINSLTHSYSGRLLIE